jgi:hypothetical protein
MAEQKQPEKTIEMRLAEIEDKLSQMHITEEEMKAYHKVSNALGMGSSTMGASTMGATPQAGAQLPIGVNRGISPIHRICIIRWNCACICPCGPGVCNECTCGPCSGGGGGGFGGGFGGFGM